MNCSIVFVKEACNYDFMFICKLTQVIAAV